MERTLATPYSITQHGLQLQKDLWDQGPDHTVDPLRRNRYIRGSMLAVHKLDITRRKLNAVQEVAASWQKRSSLGGPDGCKIWNHHGQSM